MNDENAALQVRIIPLKIGRNVIAILRVIGHDEEDGFLAHLLVLVIGLAPFNDTKVEIVGIFLGVFCALAFLKLCPACCVGQYRMFHDVLGNSLNKRIIGNRLNKDRPIVVLWRCGDIHLKR